MIKIMILQTLIIIISLVGIIHLMRGLKQENKKINKSIIDEIKNKEDIFEKENDD